MPKSQGAVNTEVILTVHRLIQSQPSGNYEEKFLFGTFLGPNTPSQPDRDFKGQPWNCFDETNGLPPCENLGKGLIKRALSTDYRNEVFRQSKGKLLHLGKISALKMSVVIRLQNLGNEPIDIKAISYPGDLPINALQLFKPEEINFFKSNKYPESRGLSSDDLYINQVNFTQNEYSRTLETENNGGYVNLVNRNFKIGPIRASIPDGVTHEKLQFDIEVKNEHDTPFSYGIYLDYDREPNLNYEYEYKTTVAAETISSSNKINVAYEMPSHQELDLAPGDHRMVRMRIAVKAGSDIPTSDEIFEVGEVEDYLVEIVAPTEVEILNAKAAIRLSGQMGRNIAYPPSCPIPANEPVPVPGEPATVEVVDINPPETCNYIVGGCNANGNCETLIIQDDAVQGDHAINFDGNHSVVIDEGNTFVNQFYTKRTVMGWIKVETISNDVQVWYDEGEGHSGFSIRINNGKLELGIRINDQLETILSPNTIPQNQWVHIAGVFNEGKFYLYMNGEQQGNPNTEFFKDQELSMPLKTGGAAWGGIRGTTAFGSSNESGINYVGKSDDFKIFPIALTAEEIKFLVQSNNNLTAKSFNPSTKLDSAIVASKLSNQPKEPADFSIFPNPAKNELNIIVEVTQESPLDVGIFDLTGRQVYEMKEPSIEQGHQLITLTNLKIPAGVYIVKVLADNVTQSEQVVFE